MNCYLTAPPSQVLGRMLTYRWIGDPPGLRSTYLALAAGDPSVALKERQALASAYVWINVLLPAFCFATELKP